MPPSAEGEVSEAGFSVVEILVALAILSISLGVLLIMISTGARQSRQAELMSEATSTAQSLLAKVGAELPIQEGEFEGRLDTGLHWRVSLRPYGEAADHAQWTVGAFRVSVEIAWQDGGEQQSVTLSTLRLGPKRATR